MVDRPRPESIEFFERAVRSHSIVRSVERIDDLSTGSNFGSTLRRTLKEILSDSGGNEVLTEVWQFGSSLTSSSFRDVDVVAVYISQANWTVVAGWRALLVREIESRVGVAADVIALSTSEIAMHNPLPVLGAELLWPRTLTELLQDAQMQRA